MENLGVVLNPDQLVLTRGRDYVWAFANLDNSNPPQQIPFPAGQLYYELQTRGETNALQEVTVTQATGGTYKLGFGGSWTDPIDFNDVTDNPHNLSGDITDALNGIPALNGNVNVLPSSLIPVWEVNLTLNAGHVLSEQMVNTLNTTLTSLYNTFAGILGVTVDFTIHDNLNLTVKVTSDRSFDEVGLITFVVDVTSTTIANALDAVADFVGVFNVLNVNFYWIHKYQVEFTGELGLQPQPALSVDDSLLTGIDTPSVTVEILEPGRAPVTKWFFNISGSEAVIKVESEEADQIPDRTAFQLVWLPEGEVAGGDAIADGYVKVQMKDAYVKGAS